MLLLLLHLTTDNWAGWYCAAVGPLLVLQNWESDPLLRPMTKLQMLLNGLHALALIGAALGTYHEVQALLWAPILVVWLQWPVELVVFVQRRKKAVT